MKLSGEEKLALARFEGRAIYDNEYIPGSRRVSLSVWASLRQKGLVADGYPYVLTRLGLAAADGVRELSK